MTSAPGLGSGVPHLHRDWARPCHTCTGTLLSRATSAPGLGPPLPHLHRDWARPCHICTGTWLSRATFAPGLGLPAQSKQQPRSRAGGLVVRAGRQACGVAVCVQACRDIELSCTNVGVVFQLLVLAEFAYARLRVAMLHCCMRCPPYSVVHLFRLGRRGLAHPQAVLACTSTCVCGRTRPNQYRPRAHRLRIAARSRWRQAQDCAAFDWT